MKYIDIISENIRRPGQPYWELSIDDKTYIVFDQDGKEVGRHTFQHVWDSSPARNAAQKDVNDMKVALSKAKSIDDARRAEAKPLSNLEQEYITIQRKWQKYYDAMFAKDLSKRLPNIDDETKQVYSDQMVKWMTRMEQLGPIVRRSVIDGTYKPPV